MNPDISSRATPDLPDELTGSLPRIVVMSDGDARPLLVIVLLFFVGGSIALGWEGFSDIKQFQQRAALRSDGHEAVGVVTGFSFGRYTPMTVHYKFAISGVTYRGKAKRPQSLGSWTGLNVSDNILVRFLPSNPTINHPDAWEWSPLIGLDYAAYEVFLWVLGALALFFLLRDRKLAREGKVAAAVVTSCTLKDRTYRVDYEFRTEDGTPINGHSDSKDIYETGARIWILYLPQRPQRNHRYPLDFFEVAG